MSSLCHCFMTPGKLYMGCNPNTMQCGDYEEWNCLLPRRTLVQCEPAIYPGEGVYVWMVHPSLCLDKDRHSTVSPDFPQQPNVIYGPSAVYWSSNTLNQGLCDSNEELHVRKLNLSQLCFSLNFYFLMFFAISFYVSLTNLLSIIPFSLSADHPRHSRRRRSKNPILLVQETV